MVHSCVVPGCNSRSNKSNCKNIKFFTLPKRSLKIWIALIGLHSISQVSVRSRICSKHFVNGKKMKNSIPELFPWQHTRSSGHIPSSTLPFQCSTLPTPPSSTFQPLSLHPYSFITFNTITPTVYHHIRCRPHSSHLSHNLHLLYLHQCPLLSITKQHKQLSQHFA